MTTQISERFAHSLSAALANPEHDYPEDFEHENGMYMSVCLNKSCGQRFTGGKYRFYCRKCREAA
jgi:hypothetical protein